MDVGVVQAIIAELKGFGFQRQFAVHAVEHRQVERFARPALVDATGCLGDFRLDTGGSENQQRIAHRRRGVGTVIGACKKALNVQCPGLQIRHHIGLRPAGLGHDLPGQRGFPDGPLQGRKGMRRPIAFQIGFDVQRAQRPSGHVAQRRHQLDRVAVLRRDLAVPTEPDGQQGQLSVGAEIAAQRGHGGVQFRRQQRTVGLCVQRYRA